MIKWEKSILISHSLLLFAGFTTTSRHLFNTISNYGNPNGHHSVKLIARKIRGEFYLKSVCLNKFMDDPLVVKMIRQTLVNYRILSESDVLVVSGDHVRLRDNSSHRLGVSDGEEGAYSKDVTWHVKSYSDITTWHSDEYFFHFIAYFTPSNYLWLRNILMHDPKFSTDEYFLGVLVQVLNDNHFDTYYANIPSTDSLTKIFRWDNRLEEHMGDFGLGLGPKSKFGIMNAMINLKYIDHHLHQIEVCENIYVVMYNLRYFFNYQTAKNNFGMMLNLEGSYNAGDDAMTLKYAQVW